MMMYAGNVNMLMNSDGDDIAIGLGADGEIKPRVYRG